MTEQARITEPIIEAEETLKEGNKYLKIGGLSLTIAVSALAATAVEGSDSNVVLFTAGPIIAGSAMAGLIMLDHGERLKNHAIEEAQALGFKVKNNLLRGKIIRR